MARQSTVKQPRLTSGGQANQTPASTTEQTEGSSEPDDESDEQGSNEEEESLPTEIPAWHPITDFQVEFDVLLEDGSESRLTERQVQTVSSGPVYRWWVRSSIFGYKTALTMSGIGAASLKALLPLVNTMALSPAAISVDVTSQTTSFIHHCT
ncbi:hypothetical protein ACHAQI_009998 [Fusarium lateritium]